MINLVLRKVHGLLKKISCSFHTFSNMALGIGVKSLLTPVCINLCLLVLVCVYVYVYLEVKFRNRLFILFVLLTGLRRCSKSCRLRWTNYLRPGIRRGDFTDDEEKMIIQLQALLGNKYVFSEYS